MPFTYFFVFVIVINIQTVITKSMTDSELIWKFLVREYPNDHPIIFLYVSNHPRSAKDAFDKVVNFIKEIFIDVYPETLIKPVVKRYLDYKKEQYVRGEINVKPIY